MQDKKKRKKRNNEEEHVDESWLLPYSDLVTLLLALFIALYASSNVDGDKFKQLADTFQSIFQAGSSFNTYPELSAPITPSTDSEESEGAMNQQELEAKINEMISKNKVLKEVEEDFSSFIATNGLENDLETSYTPDGLVITIKSNVLFESGSAKLLEDQLPIVKKVSELLHTNPPLDIIISGHTDNVPIANSNYESNWFLSTERAVYFLEALLLNSNLDPSRFSAKGYGEFHPVSPNTTEEGRSKNRRVEILILPPNN